MAIDYERLLELARNVSRHVGDRVLQNENGRAFMQVRIPIEGKSVVTIMIEGIDAENNTFIVDLAKLVVYVRQLDKAQAAKKVERKAKGTA